MPSGGELDEEVFEEAGGGDVEAGEGFVKDEQFGVVEQGGGEEDALLHAFGIEGHLGVLPGVEAEDGEEFGGASFDGALREIAETAYELEVFEAGEMRVHVGFFGDVAEGGAVGFEVVADVLAVEGDVATGGFQEAGDDLDGGGFAGAVGADVAYDFAGTDLETDLFEGKVAAVVFGDAVNLEHKNHLHPM